MTVSVQRRPLVDGATVGGTEHVNQDQWGTTGSLSWVLDGATREATEVNGKSVVDYVHALGRAIETNAEQESMSLRAVLRSAIRTVSDMDAAEPGLSATVAMARRRPTQWEWLVLGDAVVVLRHADGSMELISDERLADVAPSIRSRRWTLRASGASPRALRSVTTELQEAEDLARNRPGGFWVAADLPAAADEAVCGVAPLTSSVALASGGLKDGLHAGRWRTLEDAVASWWLDGAVAAVQGVRDVLVARDCKADDVTLVILT